MTWYRFGREIGDDNDLANYMLDAVSGANGDPDGQMWNDRFERYVNTSFEPMEVMRLCEHDGCGFNEFFVDWVIDMVQYDDRFGEDYGFEWRE